MEEVQVEISVAAITRALQAVLPAYMHDHISVCETGDNYSVLTRHDYDAGGDTICNNMLQITDDVAYSEFGLRHVTAVHKIGGVTHTLSLLMHH